MIILEEKTSDEDNGTPKNPKTRWFYVVDVHHHIGKEKKVKNLSPTSPDGSFYFYRAVLFGNQWKDGLLTELSENSDEYRFKVIESTKKMLAYQNYLKLFAESNRKINDVDISTIFENSILADQIIAFPMHDIYRDKTEPTYRFSNEKIASVTGKFPNSLRFIGFGRIIPTDGDAALAEIRRMVVEDGLRGIKLHPKNDDFPIDSEELQNVMKTTAMYKIPIIFHTSFLSEVKKIYNAVNSTIQNLIIDNINLELPKLRELIQGLKIIIGHCGWHSSPELFQMLSHPNIYGELSGIKGEVVMNFCNEARREFTMDFFFEQSLNDIENRKIPPEIIKYIFNPGLAKTYWSNKIMFGSDYPFLDQNQTIDVIRTLFKKEFIGNAFDIQNILGFNALKIIPPAYNMPLIDNGRVELKRNNNIGGSPSKEFNAMAIDTLIEFINDNNVKSIYLDMLLDIFPIERIRPDMVLSLLDKNGTSISILLMSFFIEPQGSNEGTYLNENIPNKLRGSMSIMTQELCNALKDRIIPTNPAFKNEILKISDLWGGKNAFEKLDKSKLEKMFSNLKKNF